MNYVLILGDPNPAAQGRDLAEAWGIRLDGLAGPGEEIATAPAEGPRAVQSPAASEQPAAAPAPVPLGTPVTNPTDPEEEPVRPEPSLLGEPAPQ
jgi:hypothetical protein